MASSIFESVNRQNISYYRASDEEKFNFSTGVSFTFGADEVAANGDIPRSNLF